MRLYLIDPTKPYTGSVIGCMSAPGEQVPTHVDYSGYLYNEGGNNLTLDEYRQKTGQPGLSALTAQELEPHQTAYLKGLQGNWERVSETDYEFALNCMPPQGWRDLDTRFNIFYLMEAYTGDLHSHYVLDRATKHYYKALRSKREEKGVLLAEVQNIS